MVCLVGFWLFDNFYTPATYSTATSNSAAEVIPEAFMPSSTTGQIVHHSYYSLSYNESFEQAEWVAYTLKKNHLTQDDRDRPFFIEDPWVSTKSADWRNYKNSGFDRGHLCPAGDRRFSEQAYNETFYTSNISPQNRHFNAGLWNRLEMQVRSWAKRYGTVYVITGGVLEDDLWEIGDADVDVPKDFYKIVVKRDGNKISIIAFLMPNQEKAASLKDFVVTVDEIEQRTGIDFFVSMEDTKEDTMERKSDLYSWKF
jgi:endonuclease G